MDAGKWGIGRQSLQLTEGGLGQQLGSDRLSLGGFQGVEVEEGWMWVQ
jgi:hypothetical protein